MLHVLHANTSPYATLWYLFIAFFGVVLAFQLLCLFVKLYLVWRTRLLMKRYGRKGVI